MNRQLVTKAAVPVAATALAVALAGCGSSGGSSSTSTLAPVQSGDVAVAAQDNNFVPQEVTVTEGSEITWTNDGRNQHNIVAVGDTPFSVETDRFEPGQTYSWTASKPGTYRYYCSIHGTAAAGMTGTIQVVAP